MTRVFTKLQCTDCTCCFPCLFTRDSYLNLICEYLLSFYFTKHSLTSCSTQRFKDTGTVTAEPS